MSKINVFCPECKTMFGLDIDEAIKEQAKKELDVELRSEFNQKFKDVITQKDLEYKEKEEKAKADLETKNNQILDDLINETKAKQEAEILKAKQEAAQIKSDHEIAIAKLQQKADEEKRALKQAEFESLQKANNLKQELLEMQSRAEIEKANAIQANEQAYQNRLNQKDMQFNELQKKLEDTNRLLQEAEKKAVQGSQQNQGEILEIDIENKLKGLFPFDLISPVPKGVKGVDIVLEIRTDDKKIAGKIAVEIKNTKAFQNEWIKTLTDNAILAAADVAILITTAMPKDIPNGGIVNNILIISYSQIETAFKIIRNQILKVYEIRASQEGKAGKLELLYDYFTSPKFKNTYEGIISIITNMEDELIKDKRQSDLMFERREKSLRRVKDNTILFYSDIRKIGAGSIPEFEYNEVKILNEA
jgi:hypothetical protein